MHYTFMFLVVALIYIFMAIHTLSKDRHDLSNKLYFTVSMLFAFWGLLNATLFLITEPEIASNTRRYLVFSWGLVYSVILHLVLVLSGYHKKINKYVLGFCLYIPAVINIFLYYFTPLTGSDLVLTDKGWIIANYFDGGFLWNNYFYFYYVTNILMTIIVVFIWNKRTSKKREKLQSRVMFVSIMLAFVLGSLFEIVLPLMGISFIYGITTVIALVPISGMWYAIERYGLMNFNPNSLTVDVLKMMSEGLIICDIDGYINTLNNGVSQILGYENDMDLNVMDMFDSNIDLSKFVQPSELDMIHQKGHLVQVMMSALPLKDSILEQYGFLIVFQDISKLSNMQKKLIHMNEDLEITVRKRTNELLRLNDDLVIEIKEKQLAEQKIKHLAYYDQLTKLPNLRLFLDTMEAKLINRFNDNQKFAVLFIDLDGFKLINDTKGHSKGDELLKLVAKRFEYNLIEGDLVARTGGDEFYYIVNINNTYNYLKDIMDKILKSFRQPFTIEGTLLHITCSIGAALYPEHGDTTDELVKHADIAMYEAKRKGKNRSEIFTNTLFNKLISEEKTKEELRKAIKNNEFELYYQPLVHSLSEKVIGAEALIRWNHPDLGVVSPSQFIGIAEKNGFIDAIGSWVIKSAMLQHNEWFKHLGVRIPIAINLSANQLYKLDFVDDIIKLKNYLDVDLKYFDFEVTESIFIEEESIAIETLKRLSEIGARIAIDDFGIAYSSLAYIKKLPINKIKIDKVFVDGIGIDQLDEAIIKTIVTLCNELSMDIVAEGVEETKQIEFLKTVNCHKIQGYYYSKPIQVDVFESFYQKLNEVDK